MNTQYLSIKWTTSRSRDSYGENIVTLTAGSSRFKASGGGYDMQGTVLGQYLQKNHLALIIANCIPRTGKDDPTADYGFNKSPVDGSYYLEGACGLECMMRIAKKAGIHIDQIREGKRCELKGFIVTINEEN